MCRSYTLIRLLHTLPCVVSSSSIVSRQSRGSILLLQIPTWCINRRKLRLYLPAKQFINMSTNKSFVHHQSFSNCPATFDHVIKSCIHFPTLLPSCALSSSLRGSLVSSLPPLWIRDLPSHNLFVIPPRIRSKPLPFRYPVLSFLTLEACLYSMIFWVLL